MSFVRPELAEAFARRREALLWAAALLAGVALLWRGWARSEPVTLLAGIACAGAGFALLRGALARMRLAAEEPGPGVVTVDEGRIGYFGPLGGGFVDLDALTRVELLARPTRAWRLTAEDGTRLSIPLGALGAEALLDALAGLPGLDLSAAAADPARDRVLWTRVARLA
jgi:hypothetical protein